MRMITPHATTGLGIRTAATTALVLILLALLVSDAGAVSRPVVVSSSADPASQPVVTSDYTELTLSDERKFSRWAFVTDSVMAYEKPRNEGKAVKRLKTKTPDRTDELVLVLAERTYADGSVWVKVRMPMRPNGTTAWVRGSSLGEYNVVRTRLVINRKNFKATLFKNGRRVWTARIGVGEKRWPTPGGDFYIRSRLVSTNPGGSYGPYAFGLSAYSNTLTDWPGGGMVGVHGTNEPGLIPGRISHGCIRVKNAKIRRLYKLMPAGTPVTIL